MSTDSCEHDTPGIDPRMTTSDTKNIKITQHTDGDSFKVMETYFRNQELTDVVIVAGDKRIPAHRLVLSAASKYFAERLKNLTIESTENELNFTEIDGNSLFALIEYCYTGCVKLRVENVEIVSTIARLLELSPVVEACRQFLSSERLDTGNCLRLKKLADSLECAELSSAAHAHALEHFVDVMETQQFFCLSAEDLAELLKSDGIIVPSEETVFHALMKWIQHESENRSNFADELLSCVELPLLSPAFIVEHITGNELFVSQKSAEGLIIKALLFHLSSECKPAPIESDKDLLLAIGVAVLDGFLYAVGGNDGLSQLCTVEKWDPVSQRWSYVAEMSTRRSGVSVAVLDNKLYAVGGHDGGTSLNTMECYDPRTNVWTPRASMSETRFANGIGVVNDYLYVLGGFNEAYLASMERYDPRTDTWCMVSPMSTEREKMGVGVLDGQLFAVSGCRGYGDVVDLVEAYDPDLNKWQKFSPLKERGEKCCVVLKNSVLKLE